MISVGILGGSGYTGKKILEFCNQHPFVDEVSVYGNTTCGKNLTDIFPEMEGIITNSEVLSIQEVKDTHDIYFIALPHGEALNYVPALYIKGKKIIDLGGDYRLDTKELYEKWYSIQHTSADILHEKIYGLADYYNASHPYSIEEKTVIANPGCYPTATLLSLLPLVENYSEDIVSIGVVAYSGTSGAGKSANADLLLSEMDGNARAYNIHKHRHEPEIVQELHKHGFNSLFSFTPHLLPVATGIYATSTIHLKRKIQASDIDARYKSSYADSPFIRLRRVPPHLKWAVNTNFCDIHISVRDESVIVTAAIDNLIKGASGQAVQNMNKLFGWNETMGIISKGEKNVSVYS